METHVGEIWHKLITRLADTSHGTAVVHLRDVKQTVGVFFRALGGDGALQIVAADATTSRSRRGWLQRIAGSQVKLELAWRDDQSLRLPGSVATFADPSLNKELYLWLAALAVGDNGRDGDWLLRNQALTRLALDRFPGLRSRYERLVAAHLEQRPDARNLPRADALAEQAVRAALLEPGSVQLLPTTRKAPHPVPLWLHPQPPRASAVPATDRHDDDSNREGQPRDLEDSGRRQTERVNAPEPDRGLIAIRMENILTWGEFVNVDRGTEDEDDMQRAEAVARDLDKLALSRDGRPNAARLKFDLDLPAESHDDLVLEHGTLLPEWDWKRGQLLPDRCRVVSLITADAMPAPLPSHLVRTAKRLRDQFQALAPSRVWHRSQPDGQEIDLDAYLRYATDRAAGHGVGADALYRELRSGARDLVCLLLADLSLSTDTWIDDHHRVIDVIRDSLFLFAESLNATGDRFSMYGFSSRKRDPVRVHTLKTFEEPYDARIRGRIDVIRPGYYTRLGAGIRHGANLIAQQRSGRRLLLILTDGKPNDLDQYEGRYGIEDTRNAIIAARRQGLQPFCVTIDKKGNDYLPHLFGRGGYVVIRNPGELPARLPLLYARLTAS